MSGFETDLTQLPGWRSVPESDYASLIAAADQYLRTYGPNPETWIDWTTRIEIPFIDIAGVRAFRFLQQESPILLDGLPREAWGAWAPVIIAYPMIGNGEEEKWRQDLVAKAYDHVPDEVLWAIFRRIDAISLEEHPTIERLLSLMEGCWDDRFSALLLEKASAPATSPMVMRQMLAELLVRGDQAAVRFSLSTISGYASGDELQRERAAAAGALLLRFAPGVGWLELWTALQTDTTFADKVLGRIVWDDRHAQTVSAGLSNEQLSELYIWLFRRFPPPTGSPEGAEIGFVTYEMAVTGWRGTLLNQLKIRGTKEACRAIESIIDALPGQVWLKTTLTEAKAIARQFTWSPPLPEEILDLSRSPELRLVENADQLLDAVVESLRRLEAKLQLAEPPRAIDLWDEVQKGKFRPKEEERLSDYLKGHLDDDLRGRGIVFNREVVNRRGEETDIRVSTVLRSTGDDELTVIIEAKGCWHPGLKSAMEKQLVGRYLYRAKTSHGLYVVGWYNCEKWDGCDSRKLRAPKYDSKEAQRRFDEKAQELSGDGRHVRALVIDTSLRY